MQKIRGLLSPARVAVTAALLGLMLSAGCASRTPEPVPPLDPVVQPPPPVTVTPDPPDRAEVERDGRLITFGKLRTVLQTNEKLTLEDGSTVPANEILAVLESELVRRDFRIFSGAVDPRTPIAEITRKAAPHLVIRVNADSRFLNTTGRFSRFRATADVEGIRGRDGTLLLSERMELEGPREQDTQRAGILALRDLAPELTGRVVDRLLAKSEQLLWAGLILENVATMDEAISIRSALQDQPYVDYVEILDYNRRKTTATFEILYGLQHESDIAVLLNNVPGIRVRVSGFRPGEMEILRRRMENYK